MRLPAERILRIAIGVIVLLGLAVAIYILISDSTRGAPACLAGGGGCETVADSSYSHIAGINIAVFGIVGWVLILATVWLANDPARLAGFLLTLAGFGFSVYLTYLGGIRLRRPGANETWSGLRRPPRPDWATADALKALGHVMREELPRAATG